LEMLSEIVDALRQDAHLHFRRPCIAFLLGVRLDDFSFTLGSNRHRKRPSWSTTLLSAGSALQSGQIEHALRDDFAAIDFGQSNQGIRGRYVNRTTDDWGGPSAHQNGLPPLEPGRIGPADG